MADRTATNPEILAAYDANEVIEARKLDHSHGTQRQHAAQVVAFETLRKCEAELTIEDYNNMSAEAWEAFYLPAIQTAATIDPDVNELDRQQSGEAGDMGGNYFEHTYAELLARSSNEGDIVSFQKQP